MRDLPILILAFVIASPFPIAKFLRFPIHVTIFTDSGLLPSNFVL